VCHSLSIVIKNAGFDKKICNTEKTYFLEIRNFFPNPLKGHESSWQADLPNHVEQEVYQITKNLEN
jgi:hypothetical protein